MILIYLSNLNLLNLKCSKVAGKVEVVFSFFREWSCQVDDDANHSCNSENDE